MTPEFKPSCQDENLAKLAQLAQGVFHLNSPERNWMFYGSGNSDRETFNNLYQIFSQLRADFSPETASFLDCGSGNGLAALIANIAGFEKVYGIEKNRPLFLEAQNNLSYCSRQNLLKNGRVRFFNTSYYQLINHHKNIIAHCLCELNKFYEQDGIFCSSNLPEYAQAFLEEKNSSPEKMVKSYLFPRGSNNNFKNSGLLKNGRLAADFIYIYPADPFLNTVFLPEIAKIIKPGSLLGILGPHDDKINLKEIPLSKREELNFSQSSQNYLALQVFQKK